MAGSNIMSFFDSLSSKSGVRYLIYSCSLAFFFALIFIPPILGIVLKWNTMADIFGNSNIISRATSAIYASFAIALFVSFIDMIAGLPMAWFITRG